MFIIRRLINKWIFSVFILLVFLFIPLQGVHSYGNFVVYSVYKSLDMGVPGQASIKDYYLTMGSRHGLKNGSLLQVSRRISTYDLLNQKLYKELTVPIATVKVIHTEGSASIARIENLYSQDKATRVSPQSIMVGDVVEKIN